MLKDNLERQKPSRLQQFAARSAFGNLNRIAAGAPELLSDETLAQLEDLAGKPDEAARLRGEPIGSLATETGLAQLDETGQVIDTSAHDTLDKSA